MPDILTTGELLIDFTPVNAPGYAGAVYPNPGGAPGNVAVQLARLGVSAGFAGKVGGDHFGRLLRQALDENGVDTRALVDDPDFFTTLAFVHLTEEGDRSFSFCRKPGADTQLRWEEIGPSPLEGYRMLHFGSLSLTTEPGKSTTLRLVEEARKMGLLVSYDPNWRPPLWPSQEAGVAGMSQGLELCHLLKVSEEELTLLTGCSSMIQGTEKLHSLGVQLILITLGPHGCVSSHMGQLCHHPTFNTKVIDTTGSGDSFWGAFLFQLMQNGFDTPEKLHTLDQAQLAGFCRFANAAGSVCATKPGGIPALPTLPAILACLSDCPLLETEFRIS